MAKTPKRKPEYYATKIRAIVQITARLVKNNPNLADDSDYLWATLAHNVEALQDKSCCGGCGRSMKVSIYEADLLDALLILAMAEQVQENLKEGLPFTEANKVHIPTLKTTQGILKRQTKCDYLGLVKQPDNWKGTGFWLLTGWAWKALRGEEIPKAVKYWEGNLLGRSERTTTLSEMFNNHRDIIESAIAKRKSIRSDYRSVISTYSPRDWMMSEEPDRQRTLFY